jgi:hypothetical protein
MKIINTRGFNGFCFNLFFVLFVFFVVRKIFKSDDPI